MLSNIDSLYVVLGLSFLVAFACMSLVQYSRFVEHMKAHADDDKESVEYRLAQKFAFVPYLLIPALFVVICTVIGAIVADTAVYMGYIHGAQFTAIVAVAATVVLFALADFYLISKIGDAAYYLTVEKKAFLAVAQPVAEEVEKSTAISDEDLVAIADLVRRLRQ